MDTSWFEFACFVGSCALCLLCVLCCTCQCVCKSVSYVCKSCAYVRAPMSFCVLRMSPVVCPSGKYVCMKHFPSKDDVDVSWIPESQATKVAANATYAL